MTIPEPTTTYEDLNTQSQQSDQMQRQIRPGPIQISLLIDSSCSTLQTVLIKATNEAFYNIVWDPQNLATKEGFDMYLEMMRQQTALALAQSGYSALANILLQYTKPYLFKWWRWKLSKELDTFLSTYWDPYYASVQRGSHQTTKHLWGEYLSDLRDRKDQWEIETTEIWYTWAGFPRREEAEKAEEATREADKDSKKNKDTEKRDEGREEVEWRRKRGRRGMKK